MILGKLAINKQPIIGEIMHGVATIIISFALVTIEVKFLLRGFLKRGGPTLLHFFGYRETLKFIYRKGLSVDSCAGVSTLKSKFRRSSNEWAQN